MTVYATSDWHIGHRFVAGLRGFTDTDDHDNAILTNLLAVLTKHDRLKVLGDVTASAGQLPKVLELVGSLPCPVDLISGNHDGCHPMHRDAHRWQPRYLAGFASVQAFARLRVDGREVLLSHFPYHTDRGETVRYSQYRLRDEGLWLLHGHTHGPERVHGHEVHVGLDAWGLRPVSVDAVAGLIREADPLPNVLNVG